jgi:glyoxylase-like metal-dependent hydrolase (beta-lactamase superfamily II)
VGDTLMGTFPYSIFPPFAEDIRTMILSWNKLLNTQCKLFLPGHGNPIKRSLLEKEYHKYGLKYKIFT